MKPGWKSTEFWIALGANLTALAVLLGLVSPEQMSDVVTTVTETSGNTMAWATMAVTNFGYAISRGLAKKE